MNIWIALRCVANNGVYVDSSETAHKVNTQVLSWIVPVKMRVILLPSAHYAELAKPNKKELSPQCSAFLNNWNSTRSLVRQAATSLLDDLNYSSS